MVLPLLLGPLLGMLAGAGAETFKRGKASDAAAKRKARTQEIGDLLRMNTNDEGIVNQRNLSSGLLNRGFREEGLSILKGALGRQQTAQAGRAEQRGITAAETQANLNVGNIARTESAEARAKEDQDMQRATFQNDQRKVAQEFEDDATQRGLAANKTALTAIYDDPKNREALTQRAKEQPGRFNREFEIVSGRKPGADNEFVMTEHGVAEAPRMGGTRWTAEKRGRLLMSQFGTDLKSFNDIISRTSGGKVLPSADKGKLESLHTQMTLKIKNAAFEDLGALQAPDLEIIDKLLPVGTGAAAIASWTNSGKQAALETYLAGKMAASDTITKDWRGFDTMSREFMEKDIMAKAGLVPQAGVGVPAEEGRRTSALPEARAKVSIKPFTSREDELKSVKRAKARAARDRDLLRQRVN